MTKKASALPCLSFIFLISQRENSPSCPGHLGEEEALTQLSRCLLSPESCTERHKSRKGRACRPPSALMPFYIFRRTFHISTRSCKNLSWAVPLINFTLWHTSELSGHTEVLLASVPTHLTVSPETIPWRPPYRFDDWWRNSQRSKQHLWQIWDSQGYKMQNKANEKAELSLPPKEVKLKWPWSIITS